MVELRLTSASLEEVGAAVMIDALSRVRAGGTALTATASGPNANIAFVMSGILKPTAWKASPG